MAAAPQPPASLPAILAITFLGSVSGGAFWTAIYFITAHHYRFTPSRNLALAALMGAAYSVAALRAGSIVSAAGRLLSPRALLAACLMVQALAALSPILLGVEAAVWAGAVVGVVASAVVWPLVESYLAAGRHGAEMRSVIGWFNVVWTPAVALPLLTMPLLASYDIRLSLALTAVANALALAAVARLPLRPGRHESEAAAAHVGREYAQLLRSASWLLPLSYVLSSTISPMLPYRLAAIGVSASIGSVVAATWMVARFVTLAVMSRAGFWHGRWGTLALGAAGLVAGLAAVLLAGSVAGLLVGLSLFGVGMGLTYYAALYYALAVGHAEVEAGGTFEGLVGVGYTIGPLLGLGGLALGGAAHQAQATVGLTWAIVALASWPALRPWAEARRRR